MKFWLTSCIFVLGMSLMAQAETPVKSNDKGMAPNRLTPPPVSSPSSVSVPKIEKRQLSNGIPVWFMERRTTPLVTACLFVKAGAVDEPINKMGLAALTAECLDEGTAKYDALQFAEQSDNIGSYFNIDQSYFGSTISLTVPSQRLAQGLDLMSEAVIHPTFPDKEIARLKNLRLTSFMQQREDPSSLASCAFSRLIYRADPENRQGYSLNGLAQTYASLNRQDVVSYYKRYYAPQNAFFSVTGDVDIDKVMEQLESKFGSWKRAELSRQETAVEFKEGLNKPVSALKKGSSQSLNLAALPKTSSGVGKILYVVDRPGSHQSVLRVGRIGFARNTKYFFPLKVMNTALGGSFMSRLNQNLREKNGYTYGARSMFVFRKEAGPFLVATDVQADKTVPALREILNEIESMSKKMDTEELERTENYICYGYPQSFETSLKLAQRLLEMQLYNLPDDYYDNYVDNIRKVDAASMNMPRLSFFRPETMVMVAVGDASSIAEQLKDMPGWKMEVLSVDAVMGPDVPLE
ncbi:MAG: M16 family metallopeptidase [Candidatus Bruticola sp.]